MCVGSDRLCSFQVDWYRILSHLCVRFVATASRGRVNATRPTPALIMPSSARHRVVHAESLILTPRAAETHLLCLAGERNFHLAIQNHKPPDFDQNCIRSRWSVTSLWRRFNRGVVSPRTGQYAFSKSGKISKPRAVSCDRRPSIPQSTGSTDGEVLL